MGIAGRFLIKRSINNRNRRLNGLDLNPFLPRTVRWANFHQRNKTSFLSNHLRIVTKKFKNFIVLYDLKKLRVKKLLKSTNRVPDVLRVENDKTKLA